MARTVAVAYQEAPNAPDDPFVRAAYAELSRQVDEWFGRITTGALGEPVRVVFTRGSEEYGDSDELAESVRSQRLLLVPSAAYDHDRRHPLLDHAPGGAHDRFRAVHDIVSHGWFGHDFSRDGEFSAWLSEDLLYRGPARWALATELHAQHSVRWTTGDLAPFKAVLVDTTLLTASIEAGLRVNRQPATDRGRACKTAAASSGWSYSARITSPSYVVRP
jgi:hypothetical protein